MSEHLDIEGIYSAQPIWTGGKYIGTHYIWYKSKNLVEAEMFSAGIIPITSHDIYDRLIMGDFVDSSPAYVQRRLQVRHRYDWAITLCEERP